MAKIVIIDSGVNINHPKLAKYNIKGMSLIKDDEGNIKIDDTFDDTYGHGTAVTNLICKNSEHNDVFMIKIFYNDYQAEEELLTAALTYVYENMECDIVNMSLGLTEYESLTHLRDICNKLNKKGVILISAFDNFGSVSFPAAFDNVIGVETSFSVKKNKEYEYVENSYVNILAKGGLQRVAWTNQDFIITKGNSFATPFITCVVADAINKNEVNISNVHKYLKENAINIVDNSYKVEDNKPIAFVPQKAVIFPFNKEMHSIVRFHNKLELNKIAARWPAKAVTQFFFS